ncbi:hypothetical protein OG912_38525 (plasmid) [Streptomyces sp. NBC_00464]|uniref:hypothetical protein n=1 Tax=Streptomyces sp. NBC_00464 TaxID=2975751 RepID=UPI002E16F6A0
MNSTPPHDVEHTLAYPEPPASPLWHRRVRSPGHSPRSNSVATASFCSARSTPPDPAPRAPPRPGRRPAHDLSDNFAIDGYVDAIPAPGSNWGTATFDLIHSPNHAGRIAPDTPDTVYACTTGTRVSPTPC